MDDELTNAGPINTPGQLLRQLHDAPANQKRWARATITEHRRSLQKEIERLKTLLAERKHTPNKRNWIQQHITNIEQEVLLLTPPFPPPPGGHGTGTSPTSTTSTP